MSSFQQAIRARQCRDVGRRAAARGQWATAAHEFERGLQQHQQDSGLWLELARARMQLNDLAGAQQAAERLFKLEPLNPGACKLLSTCLYQRGRLQELVQVCERLPVQVARDEQLLLMHAEALMHIGRLTEAVPLLTQALELNIKNPMVHFRLGMVLTALKMPNQAAVCFETAVLTDKDGSNGVCGLALSHLVMQLSSSCNWSQLRKHLDGLLLLLREGSEVVVQEIAPLGLLAIDASPAQQLRSARLRSRGLARSLIALPPPAKPRRPGRLRIAYLSSDFFCHATVALIAELLELHGRERFEVFLYCHSVEDGSAEQRRVRSAAEHFRPIGGISDIEAAQQIRADGIDLLIDLKGHTRDSRMQILAARPAPLQLSFLGFPGSTGADFVDYVVGDPVVTPLKHALHYSERIAQLPHSYQPNDRRRPIPPAPTRAALGLPEDEPVLVCFNQPYKITPELADCWACILLAAPRAVLWLLAWNFDVQQNLSRELAARGVPVERLVFASLVDASTNQARLQCADLFLDTWPCNAHTTASDALWAGVPVLTVPGETFASRVAASLVQACELSDFVCASPQAYVDKAVGLLTGLDELRAAQAHLRERRMGLPLFDSPRYTRDFEALLLRMWTRHEAGLPPEHLPAAVSISA